MFALLSFDASAAESCWAIFQSGHHEKALPVCRNEVKNGNENSMLVIADIYMEKGREYDPKAFQWLVRAADEKELWWSKGRVKKLVLKYETIPYFFEDSIKNKNRVSLYILGDIYREGRLVPKDESAALNAYLKSANAGYPAAIAAVGYSYIDGMGVEKDEHKAMVWIRKAAYAGYPTAQLMYADDLYADKYTSNDFEAFELYQECAEADMEWCQMRLGIIYFNGDIVQQNIDKARFWLGMAAKNSERARRFIQQHPALKK